MSPPSRPPPIQRSAQGTFVYVVTPEQTVALRPIKLAAIEGDNAMVESGVAPGERVVVDGADRLREGAKVETIERSAGAGECRTILRQGRAPHAAAAHRRTMNPSRPFILRPVATSLFMAAILLSGIMAYRLLPLSALPEVDYPTIQVVTFYPGASPEVMTSSVTAPLERQFGQIPGLRQMSSTSSGGASVITLQFNLDLSLDVAEQGVQAAINAASNLMPPDLPAPPVYSKVNPADAPILTLGLTSKTLPLPEVQNLADTRLAQKISQVSGVGLVTLSGGQRPAVRVQANPKALAAQGLTLEDVRTAIAAANVNRRRAASTAPSAATPSTPTTSCARPPSTRASSSPIATARRSTCPMSPT